MGAEYDQKDALGFINLIGLPIKMRASRRAGVRSRRREMKLWGGRFEEGPSEVFERFSGSLHFDRRLMDCRYSRLAGVCAGAGARRDSDGGRARADRRCVRRDPRARRFDPEFLRWRDG